jgi:ABC-type cobalamin transport system permease subunit
MIEHFASGAVMGAAFGLVLIRTDTAGLRGLLEGAGTTMPTALFLAQGALTFGTLGMAVAVMTLADDG